MPTASQGECYSPERCISPPAHSSCTHALIAPVCCPPLGLFAVSAIVCTRSEAELAGIFASLAEFQSIQFYSFNTVGQILRHLLLKVTPTLGGVARVCKVGVLCGLFLWGCRVLIFVLWVNFTAIVCVDCNVCCIGVYDVCAVLRCAMLCCAVQGTMQDHVVLQDRLRRILGEMTFAEAYQRSGGWVGGFCVLVIGMCAVLCVIVLSCSVLCCKCSHACCARQPLHTCLPPRCAVLCCATLC